MIDLKRTKWIWLVCLGAGVALIFVLRNQDSPVSPQSAKPVATKQIRERAASEEVGPAQLGDPRQEEDREAATAAPVDAAPIAEEAAPADGAETVYEDDKIYTMDTLPKDGHGIYRVLVDGEVVAIAIDGSHEE